MNAKPTHVIDEVMPVPEALQSNSIGEAIQRVDGRVWRDSVRIQANNETKIFNVFKVTGLVEILDQVAIITAAPNLTNCTNVCATYYDGSVSTELTNNTMDLSGVPVGSAFFKDKDETQPYTLLSASAGQVYEPSVWKSGKPFWLLQKDGQDCYIRFHVTTNTVLDFTMYLEFSYRLINGATLEVA